MASPSLDEFIDRIVREVIRRLRAEEDRAAKARSTFVFSERLITASSIESIPSGTREVTIGARAILTPLARDEARDRGIQIIRQTIGTTK